MPLTWAAWSRLQIYRVSTGSTSDGILLTFPGVDDRDRIINLDVAFGLIAPSEGEQVLADVGGASLERDGEVNEVELGWSVLKSGR